MSTQGQKEIPYREWSRQKGGLAAVATVTCQKLCFAAAGQQNERSVPERESPTIPVTYKNEVYYSTTTFWTLTLSPFTRRSRKTPETANPKAAKTAKTKPWNCRSSSGRRTRFSTNRAAILRSGPTRSRPQRTCSTKTVCGTSSKKL